MVKRAKQPVNKSAFVREFIKLNPEANRKAVEEAWLAAGHDGVISSALVSGLRREMGLTGDVQNQPKAETEPAPATRKRGRPKGKSKVSSAESNGTTVILGFRDEPSPGSPTARGRGRNQGKSAFVTEHLRQNPQATDEQITEAWSAAGNEGTISGSLIYKIRADEGLTGKRGARGRGAARKGQARSSPRAASAAEPTTEMPKPLDRRTNRGRVVAEVEADIDRLLFKLMGVGGMETIEDELRKVRRRLILSQGE